MDEKMVDVFIIQIWQFFIGLIVFLIAVVGAAVAITRYVTRFEGKIILLEERINTLNKDLGVEKDKLSFLQNYFLELGLRTTRGKDD